MIELIYRHFRANPSVTTDSRQVVPGSLFFALRGDHFDGNRFALQAVESGASLAVTDDPALPANDRFIRVPDTLKALQALALHHRRQCSIPVIGITGTNGKTTTKELLYRVLSKKYRTVATEGNLNNHIGVPLTLLRIMGDTGMAIIEMGANHPGEIDFLCRLAEPSYGLITNVGKAHLEGFGSYEGVIRTKTELYRYLAETGGTVFLHRDDEVLAAHASGMRTLTYGSPPADLPAGPVTATPFVSMELTIGGTTVPVRSKLYGKYNAANMMAAAAVGMHFQVAPEEIRSALEGYEPVNNRSQIVETGRNRLILDAYNANPSSMRAGIESFLDSPYSPKILLLGDMLELGEESDREHLAILEWIGTLPFEEVYLIGPQFTRLNTHRGNICFHDSDLALLWFEHHPPSDATILIKGSRGIRLEKVVPAL